MVASKEVEMRCLAVLAALAVLVLALSGCSVQTRTSRVQSSAEALAEKHLRRYLPEILAISDEMDDVSLRMCSMHCLEAGRSVTPSYEFFCHSLRLRALCLRQQALLEELGSALEDCDHLTDGQAGQEWIWGPRSSFRDEVTGGIAMTREACALWLQETKRLLEAVADYQESALPAVAKSCPRRRRLGEYALSHSSSASAEGLRQVALS